VRVERDNEWSALLRAANAGDALAYQRFLKQLAPVLRSFVRRILARAVAPEAEAEDIVQEILLAIHTKRHTWIETAPVAPWVFTIARHKAIDALRRRGRRIDVPIDDYAETLADDTQEPNLIGLFIDRHLDSLPGVQRKVVKAIAVSGNSIAEAAESLAMTRGAVRVALHRGLATLAARTRGTQTNP
jgi:RNA polymerase sigma-70 factor (ECF subfamily)